MKKSDFFEVQIRIYNQYIKKFNDMIQLIPFKRMVNVNGETKQMYALRLNPVQPVEFDVLARLIAQRTTLTEYEVEFVLSELQTVMIENLELGRGVRFGRLGTFEPSLKAEAVESEKELNLSTVKKVNIIYKPSLEIKKALKSFRFRIIR
ncbi:MAG: HU family DNA-binding protein [Candidatus Onthomorpha sp.]|nr:HU family DNA-binding protein [Candidatus Onthomorpha sp.]